MATGTRVMMWANYRRNHVGQGTVSVPSPFDGDDTVPWWYDKICELAPTLAAQGFTDILFPNPIMTQSGAWPTGDGYGPFDDYDIGSKGNPTRFGNAEQLRRAIAVCHANGLNVLLDVVNHQRMGGRNGVYRYRSATGTDNGRFPKDPSCFRGDTSKGYVAEDPVPDVPDDFSFGDELAPVNSPNHYVWDGLIKAGDWLFRTTGADGARLDDMKGMAIPFMKAWMNAGAMDWKWFFGEYASGNRNDTDWWVAQVDGRASATDFDFHYNMAQPMCMQAGSGTFRMASLAGRGMIGSDPMHAVPFVESMDSDTNGFATIVDNKLLAYALMLPGEGLPCCYIRDYLAEPDCYGMHKPMANLVWIARMLGDGPTVTRWGDDKVYVFERTGNPGVLVALNNDVWNPGWKTVTVQTHFGANRQLHDYTGQNGQDCWTDGQGRATFGIPPGADGKGYGCWAPAGHSGPVPVDGRSTKQVLHGEADLDIGPAINGAQAVPCRLYIAADTPVTFDMVVDRTGWAEASTLMAQILGPDGKPVASATLGAGGVDTTPHVQGQATHTGWHTLELTGVGLPAAGSAWNCSVNYTAPKEIAA